MYPNRGSAEIRAATSAWLEPPESSLASYATTLKGLGQNAPMSSTAAAAATVSLSTLHTLTTERTRSSFIMCLKCLVVIHLHSGQITGPLPLVSLGDAGGESQGVPHMLGRCSFTEYTSSSDPCRRRSIYCSQMIEETPPPSPRAYWGVPG